VASRDPIEKPIIFDDDAIIKIKRFLRCDMAEADRWRKLFAKGDAGAHIIFRQKAQELGYTQGQINTVVDDLDQLVYYSFCKSHAVSYAQVVWALAYWKAHRTHEFWCAALNHCNSEYRKWVHYREARCSGLLLSRASPPYSLSKNYLVPANSSEQKLLSPFSPIQEYKEYGYWTHEEFLPSCGLWKDPQKRLDWKESVRFRGLIACGRTIQRDWGTATLICLGVGNRQYIDLVIPDSSRGDLFKWAVLEGHGLLTRKKGIETIEVEKIRGRVLESLTESKTPL
jgi:hypothetical protein